MVGAAGWEGAKAEQTHATETETEVNVCVCVCVGRGGGGAEEKQREITNSPHNPEPRQGGKRAEAQQTGQNKSVPLVYTTELHRCVRLVPTALIAATSKA